MKRSLIVLAAAAVIAVSAFAGQSGANIAPPDPTGGQHMSTICHRSVTGLAIITVFDKTLWQHASHGDTFVASDGTCLGPPILPILPGFGF